MSHWLREAEIHANNSSRYEDEISEIDATENITECEVQSVFDALADGEDVLFLQEFLAVKSNDLGVVRLQEKAERIIRDLRIEKLTA